jgi:nitrite reductase/ring-hydroxylating ferredoxin subunit
MSSVRAQIIDLLGHDPDQGRRPTLEEARAALPPGAVVAAREGDRNVALLRLRDGRYFVVPDHCPHDGGPLSDGFLEGDTLICSRHGWEFDSATGHCSHRAACVATRPLSPQGLGTDQ